MGRRVTVLGWAFGPALAVEYRGPRVSSIESLRPPAPLLLRNQPAEHAAEPQSLRLPIVELGAGEGVAGSCSKKPLLSFAQAIHEQ